MNYGFVGDGTQAESSKFEVLRKRSTVSGNTPNGSCERETERQLYRENANGFVGDGTQADRVVQSGKFKVQSECKMGS